MSSTLIFRKAVYYPLRLRLRCSFNSLGVGGAIRSLFPKNFGYNPHFSGTLRLLFRLISWYMSVLSGAHTGAPLRNVVSLRLINPLWGGRGRPPLQMWYTFPFGCRGWRPRHPVRCSSNHVVIPYQNQNNFFIAAAVGTAEQGTAFNSLKLF